jgi:hypothetical protein
MTHTTTMTQLKVSWIRNQNVPQGFPAKGRLNCRCGNAPESDLREESGDVVCACGTVYTYNGWIKEQGLKIKFKIGQKVIFTNDYGVCFGEKTITGIDASSKARGVCYFYEPTDTPWFATSEENLKAVK